MPKKLILFFILLLFLFIISCSDSGSGKTESKPPSEHLAGTLLIYHAGSMTVPVKQACDSFMALHPDVKILTEAAGSKDCARKISELARPCDIFFSADYKVIEDLLEPEHATWNIRFATNEMALVYHQKSRYASIMDTSLWIDILNRHDVIYARSDPASDPCGVRAVFTIKLAEKYYGMPGLAEKMLAKHKRYIRPKETDLIALLETSAVDYIFLYRSVAEQHGLPYLILPPALNLGDAAYADFYAGVTTQTPGKKPGGFIVETGAPMVYGLTIPEKAPNPALAIKFLQFFLSEQGGMKIMERNGQSAIVPAGAHKQQYIPDELKVYIEKNDE